MRTTLTLDDDLARELRERAHRSGQSFKQTVNEALRAGLARRSRGPRRRYKVRPASLGAARGGVDLDRALRLADSLEDAEIERELRARK